MYSDNEYSDMRRVSYLFPHTCNLMFDVYQPFSVYLQGMTKLADRQDNFQNADRAGETGDRRFDCPRPGRVRTNP